MATWMVVEDEPDLYDMIIAMYDMLGVGGIAFVTGEEAFDWIDEVERGLHRGECPQLALIDIRLPDQIDGIHVAERLRQSRSLGNMALVLMTAYKLSPFEEQYVMQKSGADLLLYKPFPNLVQLQRTLEDLAAQYMR